jgi:predicted RNA-binding Zn-ribbon protein involved in translation (DUF1610 family)
MKFLGEDMEENKIIKIYDQDVKTYWCKCAQCGNGLGWLHNKMPKYCPECGQKLIQNTNFKR